MKIGILALQGGYAAHAAMLDRLQVTWCYVRQPAELIDIDGLILPGGESTTLLNLLDETGLFSAIKISGEKGLPIFGTCAGAILLAKEVCSPQQSSFGLMDIRVKRNAYGRQLASHVVYGTNLLQNTPMEMVFIRAPKIEVLTQDVKMLASYQEEPVCVEQKNFLAASFHPELTNNVILHDHFVEKMVKPATQMARG